VDRAAPLAAFLDAARARVDEALDRYLPRPPECPAIISEAMRYSVFAGGKRLRPILTLAAADAVGVVEGRPADRREELQQRALPAACAMEMIHTYSLIHDDLPSMDNDTLRRGRPTLHVAHGEGIAILAGDGLQAEAFALLAREPVSSDPAIVERKTRLVALVGRAAGAAGMVGGQAIDLQAAGQIPGRELRLAPEGLRDMHARKTGALITAAAAGGAIIAGGTDAVVGAIEDYARHLGIAFQIIDDVLDVEGTAATLGKTAGKDARSAKPTYPSIFGVERSRALASESVERARASLEQARLMNSWLWPIASWMLGRTS
jgi:geranylgeranyl diphosphate synthase type II